MATEFKTVGIIGVGLIGGSLGLAIQQRGLSRRVVGIGRRQSSLNEALGLGAITECSTELGALADAELIIVCTPVGTVVDQIREVSKVNSTAIITDAASTKARICAALAPDTDNGLRFVGSHPLAGNHRSGPGAAQADLFEGRQVVITPTSTTESGIIEQVTGFWASLGANVTKMDAGAHDTALASTSHLPHILASLLAAATDKDNLHLVGSGWRDTTRVAAGSVELWHDIVAENRENILESLDNFGSVLTQFQKALSEGDMTSVTRLLDQGKQNRDAVGS